MNSLGRWLPAAILGVVAAASQPAQAAIKWQFSSTNTSGVTSDGVKVTASAWSNTNGTGNAVNDYLIEGATLQFYTPTTDYGLGVKNQDGISGADSNIYETDNYETVSTSGEHSVDNNERFDMVLFSFDSVVALTGLQIGYRSGDSDMTVLAYTGPDSFSVAGKLEGKKYSDLKSLGWEVVTNPNDVPVTSQTAPTAAAAFNTDKKFSSSQWLIGGYINLADVAATLDRDDKVKILALLGDKKEPDLSIPEPSSLALLMLGLPLLRRARGQA